VADAPQPGAFVAQRLVTLAGLRPGMRVLDAADHASPGSPPGPGGQLSAPGSFDVVLASLVLHLVPEPSAALVTWRELLAPGGTLAVSWLTGPLDPHWAQIHAAVDAFTAGRPGSFADAAGLPRPPAMSAALRHYGYTSIVTITETVTARYASPGEWWHASVSGQPWSRWRHIPRDLLPAARARALRMAEPLREPDGSIVRSIPVAYITARTRNDLPT
jgi:SAM-dependent methyltransferase